MDGWDGLTVKVSKMMCGAASMSTGGMRRGPLGMRVKPSTDGHGADFARSARAW